MEPIDADPAYARDQLQVAMDQEAVRRSGLVGVVGVGLSTEASGVVVELLSLQLREAGAVLHWRARGVPDGVFGGPEFSIVDDVNTVYRVSPGTWTSGDGFMDGESFVVPPPPSSAQSMSISAERIGGGFLPFPPGGRGAVNGRWAVEMDLKR